MKRTIVLLSAVLLVSTLATAGVSNPDGLEGYALTDAWEPTQGVEGWTTDQEGGAVSVGNSFEIVGGSLPENTSQVLKVNASATGSNMQFKWYENLADAGAGAVTETSMDFTATGYLYGSEYRMNIARNAGVHWAYSWSIVLGHGNWWGGGGGITTCTLATYDHDDALNADNYYSEEIPGMVASFVPGNGVWYTVEVQEDNGTYGVGNGSKTRARIYDRTSSPGAEDGWTGWLLHEDASYDLDYVGVGWGGGRVAGFSNAVDEWDNFSMTPEPTTMLLLGAGSLMLIRRKR